MKSCRSQILFFTTFLTSTVLSVFTLISSVPVKANTSFFGKISLSPSSEGVRKSVTGYTGGSYPLSAISNRDRRNNLCIGFADPKPDHILVLEKDFPKLNIKVNSRGYDTTLLIVGPNDKTIRCGDDTGESKDASINDSDWKAGTYKVWVGSFKAGVKRNYKLSLQQ
ncbi:MAG: hypothetical protein IGS23_18270 [Rivularia sp. T60_A2020_040]|nr:hypothetical protein [Rivularia sp. T60_A2020_040]